MNDSQSENLAWTPQLLQAMAAAVGVTLSTERATALATQAEPHFALLHALDDVADPTTEPAPEFHLDSWSGSADG